MTLTLPVSASGSRTAVAEAAGGVIQVASVVAALVLAATIFFLAGPLYYLPQAALGGILLAAAWNLCDFNEFRRIWKFRGAGLVGALLTLAGVIGLGLMAGIAVGIAYCFVLVVRALAAPHDAVLGRLPTGEYHDIAGHLDARPVPGVIVYRFSAPLFFLNCSYFRRRVETLTDRSDGTLKAFVLDWAAITGVDLAACEC
jgi:SulP family sulfate permease